MLNLEEIFLYFYLKIFIKKINNILNKLKYKKKIIFQKEKKY